MDHLVMPGATEKKLIPKHFGRKPYGRKAYGRTLTARYTRTHLYTITI